MKTYKIELTKEELNSVVIQLGARLDSLTEQQIKAGKEGNIKRVLELNEFMTPILSAKTKMMNELFK